MQDTISDLKPVTLQPFQKTVRHCAKCGGTMMRYPSFIVRTLSLNFTYFSIHHCAGGKDPEQAIHLMGGLAHMNAANPCAGLSEEHLHVTCKMCGFMFLMRTEDAK